MDDGDAYTLLIKPPDDVYVDEPYLSIRWDRVHRHVLSEWHAFELQSRTFDSMAAARQWVSQARANR